MIIWFLSQFWRYTYEYEIRYPNSHRAEGFSSCGIYVGRAYLTEHAAGTAMEKHIRAVTAKLDYLKVYTANERVRKL